MTTRTGTLQPDAHRTALFATFAISRAIAVCLASGCGPTLLLDDDDSTTSGSNANSATGYPPPPEDHHPIAVVGTCPEGQEHVIPNQEDYPNIEPINVFTGVQDAIDWAASGYAGYNLQPTVHICPGTYNVNNLHYSRDHLYMIGLGANRADVTLTASQATQAFCAIEGHQHLSITNMTFQDFSATPERAAVLSMHNSYSSLPLIELVGVTIKGSLPFGGIDAGETTTGTSTSGGSTGSFEPTERMMTGTTGDEQEYSLLNEGFAVDSINGILVATGLHFTNNYVGMRFERTRPRISTEGPGDKISFVNSLIFGNTVNAPNFDTELPSEDFLNSSGRVIRIIGNETVYMAESAMLGNTVVPADEPGDHIGLIHIFSHDEEDGQALFEAYNSSFCAGGVDCSFPGITAYASDGTLLTVPAETLNSALDMNAGAYTCAVYYSPPDAHTVTSEGCLPAGD